MTFHRGDTVQVNFDPVVGHEIGKTRPAVIVQNDVGNKVSPTTIVAAITDHSDKKAAYPFCVKVPRGVGGMRKQSLINCAHLRTIIAQEL
jgi:mRNA interferase MazF